MRCERCCHWAMQVMSNSFTVCDEEMQGIGVAIYGVPSLVNHSCSPNAVATFDGATLQLRAIRSIAAGDEVRAAGFCVGVGARNRCGVIILCAVYIQCLSCGAGCDPAWPWMGVCVHDTRPPYSLPRPPIPDYNQLHRDPCGAGRTNSPAAATVLLHLRLPGLRGRFRGTVVPALCTWQVFAACFRGCLVRWLAALAPNTWRMTAASLLVFSFNGLLHWHQTHGE
jgi:hypothetical protein